jgi:hypoxanthine phosphoribosyltransferase
MASTTKTAVKKHYIESDPLVIEDSFEGYPLHFFNLPLHYRDDLKSVLIPYGLVQDRIEALASRIFSDLHIHIPEQLICMCVLKGGYRFFSDLVSKIQNENRLRNDRSLPMSLEFIRVRSYINDHSSDQLEIIGLSDLNVLNNKHLLIIEDIIDTGVTMVALKKELEKFKPKTIHVVSLFTKRRKDKKCIFKPDYSGFEVPDHFIVGYALDYNEYFRDLEHICVMKESGIAKYKVTGGDKVE